MPQANVSVFLRSVLFYMGYIPLTIFAAVITIVLNPIVPFKYRHKYSAGLWGRLTLWWLNISCDLNYQIIGKENVPSVPCVVLSNHQSPWETAFLQTFLTPQTTVLKKELFWIPFFGWALALSNPIGINRGKPRAALKQLIDQGTQRLHDGIWVLIFPEGTRVAVGSEKPFQKGGAMLATHAQKDILPIAHNAGLFWPAHKFLKFPGTIKVVVGSPIKTQGRKTEEVHQESETWIQTNTKSLL